MVPPNKSRGIHKHHDLDLARYIPRLDEIPDDSTLGRLQGALEMLISERSHPMVVALQKQLERLKTAKSVIEHEMVARSSRDNGSSSAGNSQDTQNLTKGKQIPEAVHDNVTASELDSNKDNATKRVSDNPSDHVNEYKKDSLEDSLMHHSNQSDQRSKLAVGSGITSENHDHTSETEVFRDAKEKTLVENSEAIEKKDVLQNSDKFRDENTEENENEDNAKLHRNRETKDTNLYANQEPNDGHQDISPNNKPHEDDHIRPGNSRFLLNPKSEFVTTQSFPVHAMGIFNEEQEDANDEEYKMRLGVVSYPKEDLSTLTAGPVPMEDFTRSKPTNQIQFQTYSTFLEPYFRPFTDEDLQFLQKPSVGNVIEASNLRTGQKLSPYAFPPLGPHYHQQWAQQDAEMNGVEMSESVKKTSSVEIESLKRQYQVYGSIQNIDDKILETPINDNPEPDSKTSVGVGLSNSNSINANSSNTNSGSSNGNGVSNNTKSATSTTSNNSNNSPTVRSVSLGPFTERLIAAIMPEVHDNTNIHFAGIKDEDDINSAPLFEKSAALIPSVSVPLPQVDDFTHLEDRIKDEFRYVGVFDMGLIRKFESQKNEYKLAVPNSDEFGADRSGGIDWVNGAEDDEISRELRVLQHKLKEVSMRNTIYKRRLVPVMQQQLAWQEYQSILMDLDKQVDQAYTKRLKAPKVPTQPKFKKRKLSSDSPSAAESPDPVLLDEKLLDQKPAIKALMEKRERWINKIGPLFRPAYQMMREYEHPKFENMKEDDLPEEEEDEDAA